MKQFLMGNEAIGLGAIRAGVASVSGYPGTPSTEVLETIAKHNDGCIHVEWSVNEKAGLEVAAAAAYTGARSLVTMKQVGLNVASDPLMSLAYVGIKGGMVVMVADDPGPISSQTEQDTRQFAISSKLPVFDPSSPEEAYLMIGDAFSYSEKYHTPVLFRTTTRVCHGCASIELLDKMELPSREGFVKDTSKWVIFPRLTYNNHKMMEERMPEIGEDFSNYPYNRLTKEKENTKLGVITHGISESYLLEQEDLLNKVRILRIATPHPYPERLILSFLEGLDEVLCIEELDPVLERMLLQIAGKHHLSVVIKGKLTSNTPNAGENTVESVRANLVSFLKENQIKVNDCKEDNSDSMELPVRPPVLCAGCPHRAAFYAVKQAMKTKEAIFCGDIGCYTLGNVKPLDMVDTCLCMGAGITMAQGFSNMEPDKICFGFIGDSTFFASGMTGVVNAVYNQANITICILDNSTTAMTGHQPHPGTGHTMMGEIAPVVSIENILKGMGVKDVVTVNPLDLVTSIRAVKDIAFKKGVKAIIFKSPCIAVTKADSVCEIQETECIHCKKCLKELGCPAITLAGDDKVVIEPSLCTGCGICSAVCPVHAIKKNKLK